MAPDCAHLVQGLRFHNRGGRRSDWYPHLRGAWARASPSGEEAVRPDREAGRAIERISREEARPEEGHPREDQTEQQTL